MIREAQNRDPVVIRRELGPGDAEAIAALHRRIYASEHGMNDEFAASVARGTARAIAGGWPRRHGAVWLIDGDDRLAGSLALTEEGNRLGRLRWFVLAPELRGRGLGRSLVTELIEQARTNGYYRLELKTFSALDVAGRIYRRAGFKLVGERELDDWGPTILYQHYELTLVPR